MLVELEAVEGDAVELVAEEVVGEVVLRHHVHHVQELAEVILHWKVFGDINRWARTGNRRVSGFRKGWREKTYLPRCCYSHGSRANTG